METDLLSTEEVAAILKINKIKVQRWCRKILAAKIGKAYRIKKTDLDRWYEGKLLESTVFQ
ncbi:helix-turn-helix domain-containing protein [Dehalococcoidia bacterium]|nr:helix-turn-helix domain-containing protein [Dehalococcoidia bacterium]